MIDIKNKKAIFFDFGDTIASTVPTYPDRIRIALCEIGFEFTEKQYFRAFQYADYIIYKEYFDDQIISSAIYQKKIISIILRELGINMETEEAWNHINRKMAKSGYKRKLLPGAEELLKDLSKSGFKLAVISNNDGKTAEKCEQLGISKYFELIIDSTNVNTIKPDKDIFLLASEKLGIDTKDILHIGDLYGADILGARNAGIDTVWINHKDGINYEGIKVIQVSNLLELSGLFKLT